MKKALVFVVALALVVWVISWFRTPAVVAKAAAKPWPGTLGTLDAVARRYTAMQGNDAAKKLTSLAKALEKNETIEAYVTHEVSRGELTIGAPPAVPDVNAIRDLLLRESVVWPRPAGIGEIGDQDTSERRGAHMRMARALVASALSKARTQDAAGWEDLHAAWNLAKSIEPQPQMLSQTAAFSTARMINAVAWKMPLPAPPWFDELQQHDYVPRLLESFQYQAASYWNDTARTFPTKWLADSVEHDRRIAETVFKETRCDMTVPMNDLGVDLASVWRRALRYRAEREATANALRVREDKPIDTRSRCSDGTWAFDGKTLRFSREIAMAPPNKPMPLVLRLKT
ncbi:MAG TPA: hypothetical protein VJZ00_16865 [Thermoanaerobaculia bacterium]|nr:hypothetical protein [Thermoanaerobaculia bacterium]